MRGSVSIAIPSVGRAITTAPPFTQAISAPARLHVSARALPTGKEAMVSPSLIAESTSVTFVSPGCFERNVASVVPSGLSAEPI
jgi:hypothetical protein